ncbi:MAG: threonine synthase [Chitinispirillaceae bacterium]|nr:threonine synthase [Chitinispirillaceae bacterium]
MLYISTRGNYKKVSSAEAIVTGMVPEGGLFVPESFPQLPSSTYLKAASYQEIAMAILKAFQTDYTETEIKECITNAYNLSTFDTPAIVDIVNLNGNRIMMELWHGPTAAFKDVALQIMPPLLAIAKKKTNNFYHTVILVATSGDTGKAALEGFKDTEGISIIVFYPHNGVSEVQRLQMATTDGKNTFVVAVKGNFDDCQTGVKRIFGDHQFNSELMKKGFELSSANSINWGRLCPQVVYYFSSYANAVKNGFIKENEEVDFCVPTGNFGNILAGYYAKLMGLPINKLICASNKNKVLSDFFNSGHYNRKREFFRTISPSMDILLSSNLERFLFSITDGNYEIVNKWYTELDKNGEFFVDKETLEKMKKVIIAGWIDEDEIYATIRNVFNKYGYLLDTHTAVGIALTERLSGKKNKIIVASTANPYKFSKDVLYALKNSTPDDEFECIKKLSSITGVKIHRALENLNVRPVLHKKVIDSKEMKQTVNDIIQKIRI